MYIILCNVKLLWKYNEREARSFPASGLGVGLEISSEKKGLCQRWSRHADCLAATYKRNGHPCDQQGLCPKCSGTDHGKRAECHWEATTLICPPRAWTTQLVTELTGTVHPVLKSTETPKSCMSAQLPKCIRSRLGSRRKAPKRRKNALKDLKARSAALHACLPI